ncbi:TIGR03854 family LLM class F420-dependent oxidoreductase [Williamsia phyllosphaerae]|uniref:LLM class F420-dependent oxidoreductase n=1 Tax=Williamsia phyllosphaerae TaxID=885042 RepID=A0ABQ1VAD4_9NOCA|nr:TIGR03854 family LLM class F420-dependent oxidoreductase [Williamsia phyllosphaerae]GGF43511.1 LLM class F420-dependent oxidoreductase [Williamsia phyllosphaerae]
MSIRFGIGTGADLDPADLPGLVDRLEADGVDSLWFSELVYSRAVDPFVGMAYAASRTEKLKVGTSVAILPGRHPVLVAKQLLSLAALAPRRVLPVFGLQAGNPKERELFPVNGRRGEVFDESLRLLRAVLADDDIDFAGDHFDVTGAAVRQGHSGSVDVWLGGRVPAAYRRIGALGDGWLGSFVTPAEAAAGVAEINAAAAASGRQIDDDHFGITILVADGADPDELTARAGSRRPEVDARELVATGWPALHRMIDDYIQAGLSKFVIIPASGGMTSFVDRFVDELLPRQT